MSQLYDASTIKHTAKLAKIKVSEQEIAQLHIDFEKIGTLLALLQKVDTSSVNHLDTKPVLTYQDMRPDQMIANEINKNFSKYYNKDSHRFFVPLFVE